MKEGTHPIQLACASGRFLELPLTIVNPLCFCVSGHADVCVGMV